MPADEWGTYALLFFAEDFAYYWFHRIHHEVRVFWAGHVVHHSSRHYNLSTALRPTWAPMTSLPFRAGPALLGFQPWMILTRQAISLIYQFWIHTERIRRLPAPVEFVFNTPSHHRVHHRLTQNLRTFRPTGVAFHEFAALAATSARRRVGGTRG